MATTKRPIDEHQLKRLLAFVGGPPRFSLGLASYDDHRQCEEIVNQLAQLAAQKNISITTLELAPGETRLLHRLQEHLNDAQQNTLGAIGNSSASADPETVSQQSTGGQATSGTRRAVMVTGIEKALDYLSLEADRESPSLFGLANISRDAFSKLVPVPIVLWLMPAAFALLARFAPDFWHWRAATFDFTGPEPDRRRREDELLGFD